MKRVYIVHRWNGTPESDWYPWLKTELEKRGAVVSVLAMPHTEQPTIEDWVAFLKRAVGRPDAETYLVGHSMGCQAILRYLEQLPEDARVGGAILVAGFFHLMNLDEADTEIARPWLETPIDCDKVRRHTNDIFALFSDDDPWVPTVEQQLFVERLGARTAMLHAKGHMTEDDSITELPELLEQVKLMLKTR